MMSDHKAINAAKERLQAADGVALSHRWHTMKKQDWTALKLYAVFLAAMFLLLSALFIGTAVLIGETPEQEPLFDNESYQYTVNLSEADFAVDEIITEEVSNGSVTLTGDDKLKCRYAVHHVDTPIDGMECYADWGGDNRYVCIDTVNSTCGVIR